MRRLFMQREVIEIGKKLGWPMSRRTIHAWRMYKRFPEPAVRFGNQLVFYAREDIIAGFLMAAQHYGRDYGETNIEMAIDAVLEKNKELTQQLLNSKKYICDGKK